PLYFNYATIADRNNDGVGSLVAAGPTDASGHPTNGLIPDLNGDQKPDAIAALGSLVVPTDIDGDGKPDRAAPVDFNGDGIVDVLFPFDVDGDGVSDWLAELRFEPRTTT